MYYKKVWIIILIIVISSLFPSVLIARAEDEPPETPVDRTYDFSNAPYPGDYGYMTEARWNEFIQKAEEYQHQVIYLYTGYDIYLKDGSKRSSTRKVYFSAPMDGYYEDFVEINHGSFTLYDYHIRINENVQVNKIPLDGRNPNNSHIDGVSSSYFEGNEIISKYYYMEKYYIADLEGDSYQEKPVLNNIDVDKGYGMYFEKPYYGELINVPTYLGKWHDELKIKVKIPREIMTWDGGIQESFTVDGYFDKSVNLKIAILLRSTNADGYKIYADRVEGSGDSWILPRNMEVISLLENGEAIELYATLPMDYAEPKDRGMSLITADLYIWDINQYGYEEYYLVKDAHTWTKYTIYNGIVDADGDGIDDRTGLPVNHPSVGGSVGGEAKPDRSDYEDGILGTISYYFDTFLYYIKLPFIYIADLFKTILNWIDETISGWIDSFSSIIDKLFSFLPTEVVVLLGLGFTTLMIITIIRAIRGS